ncbi:MAG: NAD(P)/FAD-dependent oxidoreductase [Rhizomicrobium sp.]|jgi:thioredoxin reductase
MKQSCDVAIIGAGPYGLSVAAHLGMRGIDYRIFGKPLGTWASHMPRNMTLKSEGFASNLSAPTSDFTMKAWSGRRGIAYADQGLPITLDNFLAYGDAFRRRFVPGVEDVQVTALERKGDGFALTLDTGETFEARNVVLAIGVTWFAHTPEVLAALPKDLISHSYDHRETAQFKGRDVAVIGTGSSAIDLAHQLRASGASPHIIGRAEHIQYNCTPDPDREKLLYRLQNPPSTIGRGWRSYFCAEAPLLFYRMPKQMKERAIKSHMHPAAGWFMRGQVEGQIPTLLGRSPVDAQPRNGRAFLTLADRAGERTTRAFDHVIAATGYRVNLERVPFLSPALRSQMALAGHSPFVSDNFETSVPGLYAIGLSAMEMFGPLMRFMVGAEFAAPRVAAHLGRKVSMPGKQRAA